MCRATGEVLGLQNTSVPWERRGGGAGARQWNRRAGRQTRLGKVSVGRLSLNRRLTGSEVWDCYSALCIRSSVSGL